MRPPVLLAASVLLAAAASAATAAPQVPVPRAAFVITGGGWGHGVGMSQWGAYGQALQGRTSGQILATYYPGTSSGETALRKVRVLVVPRAKALKITSAAPFRVRDASGEVVALPPGELSLGPGLALSVDGERRTLAAPVAVKPGAGVPLTIAGKGYRGELRVTSDGKALQVVNVVALEAYLLGVVPGEMPAHWPLEALKAQAIAARTYAVASLVKEKDFDLYSDWRSQVYHGTASEAPGPTKAVTETRGRILTFAGQPALTFYYSSSGGRTRSALDTFGLDLPYLKPVPDPWDAVDGNPNHLWDASLLTGKQLMKALGLASPVTDVVTERGTDGRPALVRFTTARGTTTEVSARDVRTKLALRSTSFRLGVLQLLPPSGRVEAGRAVVLSGVVRDVAEPLLERREENGTWVRAKGIAPRADGTFTVRVRPTATTVYRLSAAGLAGPRFTLAVGSAP